jgi:CheY-like chemotaxis protein
VSEPGLRLLIVDDDGDIRALFDASLTMRGYVVDSASNGQEALELLAAMAILPAVIIVDLHMPVMDGWELLTLLARDERLAAIPVIVLTAADDPSKPAPRPETVLIKPVAMDALEAAISAVARSGAV